MEVILMSWFINVEAVNYQYFQSDDQSDKQCLAS